MAKKKKTFTEELITSGMGLSVGASVIERLPASAAKTGVQGGLTQMGSFFPTLGTLGGASLTMKQLKKLRRKQ